MDNKIKELICDGEKINVEFKLAGNKNDLELLKRIVKKDMMTVIILGLM